MRWKMDWDHSVAATERQLEYLKDLRVPYEEGLTIGEASFLIGQATDEQARIIDGETRVVLERYDLKATTPFEACKAIASRIREIREQGLGMSPGENEDGESLASPIQLELLKKYRIKHKSNITEDEATDLISDHEGEIHQKKYECYDCIEEILDEVRLDSLLRDGRISRLPTDTEIRGLADKMASYSRRTGTEPDFEKPHLFAKWLIEVNHELAPRKASKSSERHGSVKMKKGGLKDSCTSCIGCLGIIVIALIVYALFNQAGKGQ